MAVAMATGSLLCNPSASPLTIPILARVSHRPSGICCKFLNTSCLRVGGEWRQRSILKRSTRKQQQQQVCSARASAGEDQRDTKEPQFFNSPVRQLILCLEFRHEICKLCLDSIEFLSPWQQKSGNLARLCECGRRMSDLVPLEEKSSFVVRQSYLVSCILFHMQLHWYWGYQMHLHISGEEHCKTYAYSSMQFLCWYS